MQILSSYLQTNYKYTQLAFGDCAIKRAGDKYVTHFTYLGRDFINKQNLAECAIDMIKDHLGCEFIFCGCSDGSEVFDIMMAVAYKFFKKNIPFEQFPKFKAFDRSQKIIDIARKGRINLSEAGIEYVKRIYPDYQFFINPQEIIHYRNDNIPYIEKKVNTIKNSYQFDPKLHEKIEFFKGTMLTEFQKIDSDTCKIVVCRNVARYNPENYQREAAKILDKKLKSYSLVIVGFADEHDPINKGNNIIIEAKKAINYGKRLPFTDELCRGNFIHNEYFSPYNLVYQKFDPSISNTQGI